MMTQTSEAGVGGEAYTDNRNLNAIENAKMSALIMQRDSRHDSYPRSIFDTVANFRVAMKNAEWPRLVVELPTEGYQIFAPTLRLPLGRNHLNGILKTLESKVEELKQDKDRFMSNVRYQIEVSHWNHMEPCVSFKLHFDDSRVMGDEGKYIGYKNEKGETILWDRD